MTHRLALFDFDGTLADSQDWFLGIFDQVADRFGYRRLAPGDRERLRGLETKAILNDLGVPTWKLPMIAKHVRELAARDIDRIRLFPGAAEMRAELKSGGVRAAATAGGGGCDGVPSQGRRRPVPSGGGVDSGPPRRHRRPRPSRSATRRTIHRRSCLPASSAPGSTASAVASRHRPLSRQRPM